MNGFGWAYARDLRLAWRQPGEALMVIVFFAIVASLFPLGVGAEPLVLARIGPGAIWVCALLAALLSLPSMFAADYADGSLEQMALSPHAMLSWVAGKIAAHWTTTGLPLTVLSPLLGLEYGLEGDTQAVLALGLVSRAVASGPTLKSLESQRRSAILDLYALDSRVTAAQQKPGVGR